MALKSQHIRYLGGDRLCRVERRLVRLGQVVHVLGVVVLVHRGAQQLLRQEAQRQRRPAPTQAFS